MTTGKPKIYVGCALTQATDEFRHSVEALKTTLKQYCEVYDFVGLVKGNATDVYRWDIHHCIANCDLIVAICDYPSIGLGYELGTAIEKLHKPVLAFAHKDAPLSRLLIGIDQPSFTLTRYEKLSEIVPLINSKLEKTERT